MRSAPVLVILVVHLAASGSLPAATLGLPLDALVPPDEPVTLPPAVADSAPFQLAEPAIPRVLKPAPSPDAPAHDPLPSAAGAAAGVAFALAGLALYSRLARGRILEHRRRDEVFRHVKDQPGVSLSEIAERCGLGWGTAVYHLERLERAGLVMSERNTGRRRYFAVGQVARADRAPIGALQQETSRTVASFVLERPGATQGELAAALGITPGAASKQVSKLEGVGLVRRERAWKSVRLHPGAALAALLGGGAKAQA